MWLTHDTKKALSLRRLLQQGFEPKVVIPETITQACIVTDGIYKQRYQWLLELENLASEEDQDTVDKKLSELLAESIEI